MRPTLVIIIYFSLIQYVYSSFNLRISVLEKNSFIGRETFQKDTAINFLHGNFTCNFQDNPLVIENLTPRFSWSLNTNEIDLQTAFQILVASDSLKLERGNPDLWDTKKITSSQSILIHYNGIPLKSGKKYWWKVCVWDSNDKPARWSSLRWFETGLFGETDWENAHWIALDKDTRDTSFIFRNVQTELMQNPAKMASYPSPLMRKTFNIQKSLCSARAFICGLGYSELYINGNKISNDVLSPAQTSYDVTTEYITYDVTHQLKPGKNAVGIMLGNGFYGQNIAFNLPSLGYGKPMARFILKLNYTDGSTENIVSDTTWRATCGPIVFDNVYAGETYDARKEIQGWNTEKCDDSNWQYTKLADGIGGKMTPQLIPPIRKIKDLLPARILKDSTKWIIDFGQNISGWVHIKVNEKPGTVLTIITGEALTRNGKHISTASTGHFATGVIQTDVYICNGSPNEEWEPRFTYHGFQYAEISGLTAKPTSDNIKAILAHTNVEPTGTFHCSDSMLNAIYKTSMRTITDNLHSIPEDCPHREKCGWLGDAHIAAEAAIYNFDMATFFQKYLNDIESTIGKGNTTSKNKQGNRIPTMVAPGKRLAGEAKLDWGAAIVFIPWYLYQYYGDTKPFAEHYLQMKDFIAYMLTFKNQNGIIENGLGDWCPPLWDRVKNPAAMQCHPFISANAYFYEVLKIMETMSLVFEDSVYNEWAHSQSKALYKAFNGQYLKTIPFTDLPWYGSQTATVMALKFSMVPENIKSKVLKALVYDIEKVNNGHHTCGIHGLRYLYTVLSDNGLDSLAYRVLTNPNFPSQGYIIKCGLNTWPERQWKWGDSIEWDRSLNHPMHSGFAAWFHESLAGIKPLPDGPGFKQFEIKPHGLSYLNYLEASTASPYGLIVSNWKKNAIDFSWQIQIPFNSMATVYIPEDWLSLCANAIRQYHFKYLGNVPGYAKYNVGPGIYYIKNFDK